MPMHYYEKAQTEFKPQLLDRDDVFLGDIFSSENMDAKKPITCGLYRLEKGEPLVYTYTYHGVKIIIEGEYHIRDETGKSVIGRPGDVFHFKKGATITFTTPNYGLAFYTGQRAKGAA